MKKILSIILAAALMLTFPICSHAEYSPKTNDYSVDAAIKQGDTVDVLFKLTSKNGVGGALFSMVYEDKGQDYIEFDSLTEYSQRDDYNIVVSDDHMSRLDISVIYKKVDTPDNEVYFKASFKALYDVTNDDLSFKCNCDEIIDNDGNLLEHPNAHCAIAAVAVNGEYDTDVPTVQYSDTDTETETDTQLDTETETDTQTDTDTQTETDTQTDTDTQTETDTQTDTDTQTETDTQTDINTETDTTSEEPDTDSEEGLYTVTLKGEHCKYVDYNDNTLPSVIKTEMAEGNEYSAFIIVPDDGYSFFDQFGFVGSDVVSAEGIFEDGEMSFYDYDAGSIEIVIYGIQSDLTITVTPILNDESDTESDSDYESDSEVYDGLYEITLIGNNCKFVDSMNVPLDSTIKSVHIDLGDGESYDAVSFVVIPNDGYNLYFGDISVDGDYEDEGLFWYEQDLEAGSNIYFIYGIESNLTVTVTAVPNEFEDSETQTEIDTDSQTDTQLNTDTDSQTDIQVNTDTESQTDVQVNTDTESQTDTQVNTDTDSQTDTQVNTDTDSQTDTQVNTDTDSKTDTQINTDTDSQTDTQINTDTDSQTDIQVNTDTDSQTDVQVNTDTDSQTDVQVNTDTESQTDTQSNTDTESQTDTQVNTDTESQTDTQSNTDTESQTDTQSNTDTESQTDTQTDTEDTNTGEEVIIGDVNCDGKVTAKDSLLVQRSAIKLVNLNDKEWFIADVDEDKKVSAKDAMYILRYSIHLNSNSITGQNRVYKG